MGKYAKRDYEKYQDAADKAARHLVGQVESSGYVSAAAGYAPYRPHWLRDSSWVAVSLFRHAAYTQGTSPKASKESLDAANRVLKFNLGVVERSLDGIKNGISKDFADRELYRLENHIIARVGPDGKPYRDGTMDDTPQLKTENSWQMQHDSVPLILFSLKEKMALFGLDDSEKQFLKQNAKTLLEYLGKIYLTECASAWEKEQRFMHAYDVGAIHGAFEFMKEFSDKGLIDLSRSHIDAISSGLYAGGPSEFLKNHFVRNDMMYRARMPFAKDPEIGMSVDAAQIFLFNDFKVTGALLGGAHIESATVSELERRLFWKNGAYNELPVRHPGDTYFTGGRWLLLGLAFADYYAQHGDVAKSKRIVDYVIGKYGSSFPEQEIKNVESPGIDEGNYLRNNKGKPIPDLAWSYAAVIIAALSLMDAQRAEKLLRPLARN